MRETNTLSQQEKADEYKKLMIGRSYRHFKGNIYIVDAIAMGTEDCSLRVIYHSEENKELLWDRSLEEFLSPVDKIKYPDIEQKNRFELIENT